MLQIAEDYRIAQMIYDARSAAGMTQKELAKAVGTTQIVISQLEDADYVGHSLSMLRRIAKAALKSGWCPRTPSGLRADVLMFRFCCSCGY